MKNESDDLIEVSLEETQSINGGGFAYDAGFFLRELFLSAGNAVFIVNDLALNYRPVN